MTKKTDLILNLKGAAKHIRKAAKLWKEIDSKNEGSEPLMLGAKTCDAFIKEITKENENNTK